jgi:hypothetical protein
VVDEETIYQFYASKIPEEIASRRVLKTGVQL